jgi:glucosylglycerate synthase
VTTDAISQQAPEKTEPQIDSADLVVGILAEFIPGDLAGICDSFRMLPESLRVAILHDDPAPKSGDSSQANGASKGASLFFMASLLAKSDPASGPVSTFSTLYQSVLAAGEKLQARACCVITSKLVPVSPQWPRQLAQPLFEGNFDLVLPHYARRKFDGLLNQSIISPLTRCLYGKRIYNPLGPDLGISQRLLQKMLGGVRNSRDATRAHPAISLTPIALVENMQVCEVNVGARVYPPPDWANAGFLFSQVLSPIFLDMERNAAFWQRVRSSVPVACSGDRVDIDDDPNTTINVRQMIETFQLGNRDLREIWSLVLPPATMLELEKLSRLSPEQFRMPDELWVRIVFDFALAHRLRTISRDHLLGSMAPLYLAWIASYARDVQSANAWAVDRRLEKLALAYEAGKPYLVSRWRWPDRFNP